MFRHGEIMKRGKWKAMFIGHGNDGDYYELRNSKNFGEIYQYSGSKSQDWKNMKYWKKIVPSHKIAKVV